MSVPCYIHEPEISHISKLYCTPSPVLNKVCADTKTSGTGRFSVVNIPDPVIPAIDKVEMGILATWFQPRASLFMEFIPLPSCLLRKAKGKGKKKENSVKSDLAGIFPLDLPDKHFFPVPEFQNFLLKFNG
jgi:hypothetical protein